MSTAYDVIVVGGGAVGAVCALALAKNAHLNIAIVDARHLDFNTAKNSARYSAISFASKGILSDLQVWQHVTAVSPYKKMVVWEESTQGLLEFDNRDCNLPALGYIISDDCLLKALYSEISKYSNITVHSPVQLTALEENGNGVELASEHLKLTAKLIIGADGANSWVREQAGIDLKSRDYNHTAIVATVGTELSHQNTAWQRFLKTGPLAFLPLQEANTSSIVWSIEPTLANELLKLDDAQFKLRLAEAFDGKLGRILEIGQRYHFPLQMRHVRQYVKTGIALVGDAAHTVHPLAGQGLNMGLMDALVLVKTIQDNFNKQRDFASHASLRPYERNRKAANLNMLTIVDGLKYLFTQQAKPIQKGRELGLQVINKFSHLKNIFVNYASGGLYIS